MTNESEKTLGEQVIASMQEIVDHQNGVKNGVRVYRYEMVYPDVRELRKELGLTQQDFATEFGFSVSAVRHWEQGTRIPEKSARILLMLIAKDAESVRQALRDSVRRIAAE
jgi:putative transcriptional regulator